MILMDRLLMMAEENETIADLLDQATNVARMIDPNLENKDVMYGPLQRMHFEWQNIKYQISDLNKMMDQYINSQNRQFQFSNKYENSAYPLTTTMATESVSMWPSNPGWGSVSMITKEQVIKMQQDLSELSSSLTTNKKTDK